MTMKYKGAFIIYGLGGGEGQSFFNIHFGGSDFFLMHYIRDFFFHESYITLL